MYSLTLQALAKKRDGYGSKEAIESAVTVCAALVSTRPLVGAEHSVSLAKVCVRFLHVKRLWRYKVVITLQGVNHGLTRWPFDGRSSTTSFVD